MFGRTGLEVSVAGLGCGGHSRLGRTTGATEAESIDLVRRALDLGVTYIDTARAYGTEEIVGRALAGRRDGVLLSTKAGARGRDRERVNARTLRGFVEESLEKLRTDIVDVFHLHGVSDEEYDYCVAELVPELEDLRTRGSIRFLAISEPFGRDTGHTMLQRAVEDDCWDVMMVGFNPLNPSARHRVFPMTVDKGIAVEVMFAVRRALSRADELSRVVHELAAADRIDATGLDLEDPLGFLVHEGGAESVVDACYRFARHEPGCTVVLTGTGNVAHLEANVRSINGGPLPPGDLDRLTRLFGHLDHLSAN